MERIDVISPYAMLCKHGKGLMIWMKTNDIISLTHDVTY